jgi:hypothetical protein
MTMTMLEWREGDRLLRDETGRRLLFTEEVARKVWTEVRVTEPDDVGVLHALDLGDYAGRPLFEHVTGPGGTVLARRGGELTADLVGELAGAGVEMVRLIVKTETITHHNTAAQRARRNGRPAHFPAPVGLVRRTTLKANGQPLTAVTPVWLETEIDDWAKNRLGPGGRPRRKLSAKAS